MKRALTLALTLAVLLGVSLPVSAQFKGGGGFGTPGFTSPAPAAAAATTTWDPAAVAVGITLSPDKLTATSSTGANAAFRSIASHLTGKLYAEFTVNAATFATVMLGVSNSSENLANIPGVSSNNSDGYNVLGGAVVVNNITIAGFNGTTNPISSFGSGTVIGEAVDLGAKLIWYRGGAGNWNNNASANPATGVGGLDLSSIAAGPYLAIGGVVSPGNGVTANFGATAYTQTPPAGFANW